MESGADCSDGDAAKIGKGLGGDIGIKLVSGMVTIGAVDDGVVGSVAWCGERCLVVRLYKDDNAPSSGEMGDVVLAAAAVDEEMGVAGRAESESGDVGGEANCVRSLVLGDMAARGAIVTVDASEDDDDERFGIELEYKVGDVSKLGSEVAIQPWSAASDVGDKVAVAAGLEIDAAAVAAGALEGGSPS